MADTRTPDAHDPRDLIPAYALDAVTDAERRAVDKLLMADAGARRELDEFRQSVAAFVVDAVPPADLRGDVLARIADGGTRGLVPDDAAAAGPSSAVPGPSGPVPGAGNVVPISRGRRRSWLVAAAAAAIVAIAVPTGIAVQTHQTQVQLQAQVDRVAQMLADPDAQLVASPVAGGGEASALVSGGDVLFTASGLPDAGAGEDYQLWIVADGAATSAGLFDADDPQALVEAAAGEVVAMTVEPSGGSDQPTTDPIVALQT